MSKPKLSEWFDATTHTPGSVGVYERVFESGVRVKVFQHWNGRWWGLFCRAPKRALNYAGHRSAQQGGKFRGVLK